jgi:hypothetical protein
MTDSPFRRGAISPIEAFSEAWRRIRERYWLFAGIVAFGTLAGSAGPIGLLMVPMMCGVCACYRHHFQGRTVRFSMVFQGFEPPLVVPALIAGLIVMGVTIAGVLGTILALVVPMIVLLGQTPHSKEPPPALIFAVVTFLLVLLAMIMAVGLVFAFVYPLIVDRHLSAVQAIVLSARAALGNLGGLLGMCVLNLLLGLAGSCCCYVGWFLVLPISFGATMVAYEQVFGWSGPDALPSPVAEPPPA